MDTKSLLIYYNHDSDIVHISNHILFKNPDEFNCISISDEKLKTDVSADPNSFTIKNEKLVRKTPSLKDQKVAIISPYGVNCGIATYSEAIYNKMKDMVGQIKVFAECSNNTTGLDAEHIIRCWDRKESFNSLLQEVDKYDPDITFLQHEYGTFNEAAKWNALVGHLNKRRTIVVLHSVYEHADKLIFEAPCKEIIVHTLGSRELLRARGINHCPIHVIPHGCFPVYANKEEYKFSRMTTRKTLFQYGFGFQYKGWETAIEVVDRLRHDMPEILYIGVFNIAKASEEFCNNYYNKLIAEIERRKLQENFVLHYGFRTEAVLKSYMQQCKIGMFPYWNHPEWRVRGASGAIRLALASGMPIIVGDVPFFEEFDGCLPICSSIEDYMAVIKRIFNDEEYERSIQCNIQDYVDKRSWENVTKWYLRCTPNKDFTAPVLDYEDKHSRLL